MLRTKVKPDNNQKEVLISLPDIYIGKELEIFVLSKDESLYPINIYEINNDVTAVQEPNIDYNRINLSFNDTPSETSDLESIDGLKDWLSASKGGDTNQDNLYTKKDLTFTVLHTKGEPFIFNREEANER